MSGLEALYPPQEWVDKVNEQRAANGAEPLKRTDDIAMAVWQSVALTVHLHNPMPLCLVTGV
jgi:hypothetical protein